MEDGKKHEKCQNSNIVTEEFEELSIMDKTFQEGRG